MQKHEFLLLNCVAGDEGKFLRLDLILGKKILIILDQVKWIIHQKQLELLHQSQGGEKVVLHATVQVCWC